MCGIVGIFNLSGESISHQEITALNGCLSHRGPDGDGVFIDNNIALAHKRLAILDTSARGNQPMTSRDGRWVVIFNGCIYNYLTLKQELKSRGHSFVTTTDTEVITEGLSAFGPDYIQRFNGMFAIAAWDNERKQLYLFRDRFGIKPLYYWFSGKRLIFASEIKAIIAHKSYRIDVDKGALNEYFTFQNVFTYRTLFKGVVMLPPANTVKIDVNSKGVTHASWWDYDFAKPDNTMSFEDAKEETKRLFQQAVSRQMVADVPVGSYLSGGMDSGSITAIASQHVDRLSTFTCGFDMSEVTGVEANFDERRDAELMANYFKTEHFEQVMNAGDLRWSLKKVIYHLEDLRVGMSYPNYYISRLASKFVKVCLQGTGGDELFGGYPWRYYKVFNSLNQQQFFDQYYSFWQRLVPDGDKAALFTGNIYKDIDLEEPRRVFERVFTFNNRLKFDTPEDHINNSLYFEIKTFLPGLLLVGDKLSMAHGLEERFPFLDNDLVDFAQKIPVKHKLGNLTREIARIDENETVAKKSAFQLYDDGKNVLRKAMMDFIPERIINRKKQGFSAPDESWYRGENADYVKELLLVGNPASAEFINPDYVKRIIHEHMDQHINHRLLIWSLMSFEWWCRIFINNGKTS